MEFRLLGPLELWDAKGQLKLNGIKRNAILGALLLAEGGPVELGRLIEVVWGSRYPATAGKQVRNAVSDLRHIGDGASIRVDLAGDGYQIDLTNCLVDSVTFVQLTGRARKLRSENELAAAARELHGALSLWRGPVLAGLDSSALQSKIANLNQQRLAAFVDYAELRLTLGEQMSLLGELTEWATENPLDERLTAQLMLAHCYCGAPALGLMVYERARRTLREELGVDPSGELQELFQTIIANEWQATAWPPGARPRSRPSASVLAGTARRVFQELWKLIHDRRDESF